MHGHLLPMVAQCSCLSMQHVVEVLHVGQRCWHSNKNKGCGLHKVVAMNAVTVVKCAVVAAGVVDAG